MSENPPARLQELESQFDVSLAKELVSAYLDDTQEVIEKMQEAIFNRDSKALKSVAHMLKGASRIIIAEELEQRSREIEELSASNNWLKLEASFEQLSKTFERTIEYLRQYLQ
jgi:HPt (histidine-containing phosphotransfer) domain-containing protein